MKFEMKKILSEPFVKIGWIILFFITIFVTVMPIITESVIIEPNDVERIKGLKAIKIEKSRYEEYKGEITEDKIQEYIAFINSSENIQRAVLDSKIKYPGMNKILDQAYSKEGSNYLDELRKTDGKDFYRKNEDQIRELINNNPEEYKTGEFEKIISKTKKIKTPYKLNYSRQWPKLFKSYSILFLVFALVTIFESISVFSHEAETNMERVLVASSKNLSKVKKDKLKALTLLITGQFIIFTGIFLLIMGFTFGFSAFSSQIQLEYFTSVYNITFGGALIRSLILSLVCLIVIGIIGLTLNKYIKSRYLAFLLVILVVFLPLVVIRFPNLPISLNRWFESSPIFGGMIHRNLLSFKIYSFLFLNFLRMTAIFLKALLFGILFYLIYSSSSYKKEGRK